MAGSITQLSAATFDEVVGSAAEPILVDFWAEWCGPCKMIAPILDEIATEHAGKVRVAKLNVDDNPPFGDLDSTTWSFSALPRMMNSPRRLRVHGQT